MKRLGDINFDLEEYVNEHIVVKEKKVKYIFCELFSALSLHPNNKEEYMDGTSPTLYYGKSKIKKRASHHKLVSIVQDYIDHDLQWGEIIFIVYGYLHIHYDNIERIRYK